MSEPEPASKLVRYAPLVVGTLLGLLWAFWPRHHDVPRDGERETVTNTVEADAPPQFASNPVQPAAPLPRATATPTAANPAQPTGDTKLAAAPGPAYVEPPYELPIVGSHSDDPHDEAMHPHPITAEHVRIAEMNQLIQSLNDAMSNRDPKLMRELVERFRKVDPEDEDNFQLGYGVIADCLDARGATALAAAHRFYDTYRASPLRRFVRRLCFEAS